MKKYHNFKTLHIFNGEAKNKSKIQPVFGQEVLFRYSLLAIIHTNFILLKKYAFLKNVTNSNCWPKVRMV
tara:strand:+ start:20 stop:229 length:210 start_codon:yes stop_codon:yes gene_type:complete